jgi:hypothetical protein
VLGGGGGWSQELDEAVARVPSHLRLIRPGYLPFADLPGFLGGAVVVAAPSRGEGFGLQVLEAMACGAPVLTTYRTSLPEVGGDAVAYTEPDADSIAVALRALLDDPQRRATPGHRTSPGPRRRPPTWPVTSAPLIREQPTCWPDRSPKLPIGNETPERFITPLRRNPVCPGVLPRCGEYAAQVAGLPGDALRP